MKLLFKILTAPVLVIMRIIILIGSAVIYISGLALGIVSGVFAVIGLVYIVTGSIANGIIGLIIAYLLSPYGLPMFAIILLGTVRRASESLKYMFS